MRLQFDVSGSAEMRAVCAGQAVLAQSQGQREGDLSRGAEIAEVPYRELSRLAGVERSLKCK